MTESAHGTRVFIELGPRPEEPTQLVRPGARSSYPADVLARLDSDAETIIARYRDDSAGQASITSRSALLPLLHLVQSEDGYITPAGIDFCSGKLGLTGAEVAAVSTFYSMYRRGPTGEYLVGVCTNTLCAIMGGDAILEALEEHLGSAGTRDDASHSLSTSDGKITLEHVECNAACDYAPVVMVNWEFFDNQTPESARSLVDALRSGERVTPSRGATLCSFRETARTLAGFEDSRVEASEAETCGDATLAGLRVAHRQEPSATDTSTPGEGK
ncbi:NADH-quinone oxidoreductase subunit NuoE [Rhodococcus sp. IEGM 1379]|uniref:NADH-quinone oxidoreductase subunit NuoE n=1 Tax=Rhodococcus sp. IEGM 1379 TaxID=3047086 RepID=UPI0024B6584D|nr:NADH-quinone oxidoreductase subunit NuoE [Rhodococcus sp. IEGM 1379]MDI9918066.1 NADH-quinone oxidoreductase subunit NuoE [Rhodococcus sp. IEGM 1379]